jgi:anti-anti-sigma factor
MTFLMPFYERLLSAGHEARCHRARIRIETRTSTTVVRVRGEVDASSSHFFIATVRRCLATPTPLIVDLTEVQFLGAGVITMLLNIYHDPQVEDGLAILTADGHLRRAMEVIDRYDPHDTSSFRRLQLVHSVTGGDSVLD